MHFDFLFCSERCGSNLMTKIMDGHPEVCGPFPSHMMRTFAPNRFRYGDLSDNAAWTTLTEHVADYLGSVFAQWASSVTADELRQQSPARTLASLVRYAYEKEARIRGKRRVFVKENHAYRFLPLTLAGFPQAKFVWVVRDPRDMALCWRDSILHGGPQRAAAVWMQDQEACLKVYGYLQDAERILLVKFENLLRDAEATCRRVCSFLQLNDHPNMLQFYRDPNVGRNADAISAWADLGKPIMPDNCGNYRHGLSELEIRFVEAVCHPLMAPLGYALDYPVTADVDSLRRQLPDDNRATPAHSPVECDRYARFEQALRRLDRRWARLQPRLDAADVA